MTIAFSSFSRTVVLWIRRKHCKRKSLNCEQPSISMIADESCRIAEASAKAISIIIIGLGPGNFRDLRQLKEDTANTLKRKGGLSVSRMMLIKKSSLMIHCCYSVIFFKLSNFQNRLISSSRPVKQSKFFSIK